MLIVCGFACVRFEIGSSVAGLGLGLDAGSGHIGAGFGWKLWRFFFVSQRPTGDGFRFRYVINVVTINHLGIGLGIQVLICGIYAVRNVLFRFGGTFGLLLLLLLQHPCQLLLLLLIHGHINPPLPQLLPQFTHVHLTCRHAIQTITLIILGIAFRWCYMSVTIHIHARVHVPHRFACVHIRIKSPNLCIETRPPRLNPNLFFFYEFDLATVIP